MIDTRPDIPLGRVYSKHGLLLTFKDRSGYWAEYTYNRDNKETMYQNSDGYHREFIYNSSGDLIASRDSTGKWYEFFDDLKVKVRNWKVYKI